MAETENSSPEKDVFLFAAVADALAVTGQYRLEYTLTPALPEHSPLTASVAIAVTPGTAASMSLQVRVNAHGLGQGHRLLHHCHSPSYHVALDMQASIVMSVKEW